MNHKGDFLSLLKHADTLQSDRDTTQDIPDMNVTEL